VTQLQPIRSGKPVLCCLLALACLSLSVWPALASGQDAKTDSRRTPTAVFDCNPGAWGDLEYVRITLEPPDHYAAQSLDFVKATRWFFKGYTRESLISHFHDLDLKPDQVSFLVGKATWEEGTNGLWITPTEAFVIGLDQTVRTRLYTELSLWDENGYCHTPFVFRQETLDERFNHSGLTEKTVSLVKSMIYSKGRLIAFSDISAVMSQIQDLQEKIRLIKVLSRKSTMMLRLKLNEHSDLSKLLDYWGTGGRAKDLKPLLESLTRVDGGWEIDVAHLLPPFARKRLYTYPVPTTVQSGPNENCHWTSFNFFNDPADDSFRTGARVEKAIDQEYDIVEGQKRLGDILLVMDSANMILHSAVYIADDIVFTKTGGRENQPWILMKLDDMMPLYASANQPLKVVVCRKKNS
jgi:hypothetical protein